MTASFYTVLEHSTAEGATLDRVRPSDDTRSVWSHELQHGSPPAALLTRAIERLTPSSLVLSRITIDLLGPVPIVDQEVRARVARPGRRVSQLVAELAVGDRVVARATAWALARSASDDLGFEPASPMPARDTSAPHPFGTGTTASWDVSTGYVATLNIHAAGDRAAWLRGTAVVVAGEAATPLVAMMAVVDTANGLAARIDPTVATFLNTDLTVHLHREPAGEWFGLDVDQAVGDVGIGCTSGVIHDERGPVGRLAQTLLVERR